MEKSGTKRKKSDTSKGWLIHLHWNANLNLNKINEQLNVF